MATSSPPDPAGLSGSFSIRVHPDGAGASVLERREVSAPFHLSKPYWTGDVLLIQSVNATAGVFSGDRLELDVTVDPGARALITSPSASRIHTMPHGRAAQNQRFSVGSGAWLEVMPELFIPQAGCRYAQATRIDVAPGGTLYFVETLAPGRVARGECLAFDELRWALEIRRAGQLLLRERYRLLGGDDPSTFALRAPAAGSYYASCCLVAEPFDWLPLQRSLDALNGPGCHLGATRIDDHLACIRLLAADSPTLRETLQKVRGLLSAVFPGLRADARKL